MLYVEEGPSSSYKNQRRFWLNERAGSESDLTIFFSFVTACFADFKKSIISTFCAVIEALNSLVITPFGALQTN